MIKEKVQMRRRSPLQKLQSRNDTDSSRSSFGALSVRFKNSANILKLQCGHNVGGLKSKVHCNDQCACKVIIEALYYGLSQCAKLSIRQSVVLILLLVFNFSVVQFGC